MQAVKGSAGGGHKGVFLKNKNTVSSLYCIPTLSSYYACKLESIRDKNEYTETTSLAWRSRRGVHAHGDGPDLWHGAG